MLIYSFIHAGNHKNQLKIQFWSHTRKNNVSNCRSVKIVKLKKSKSKIWDYMFIIILVFIITLNTDLFFSILRKQNYVLFTDIFSWLYRQYPIIMRNVTSMLRYVEKQ